MAQTPIASSSLVFKTREFYIAGTDPNTAKGDTLTFEDLDKTLLFLSQSIISGGPSSTGVYSSSFSGSGVTTVDDVGGINSGTSVNNLEGRTFSSLFDDIFFPTINPTPNAGNFSSTTFKTYEEVGDTINVTVTSTFTQGTWTVIGQSNRAYYGPATTYYFNSGSTEVDYPAPINSVLWSNHIVSLGSNNFPTSVSHSIGDQPVNSKGASFGSPTPAGELLDSDVSFTGIYPWFYGSSSAATFSVADVVTEIENLYNGGATTASKSVTLSTGNITGYFYNTSGAWCWFAHPASSTAKTTMYQNNFNTNPINSAGTFNNNGTTTITATGYWNNVSYRIYITNARTVFTGTPNQYTVQLQN